MIGRGADVPGIDEPAIRYATSGRPDVADE
jgi:hypothetical protein